MNLYIVTGGAGFIGSNFIRYLLQKEKDSKFIVYDSLTYSGLPFNLFPFLKRENIFVVSFGKDFFKLEKSKVKGYKKVYSKKDLQKEIDKFILKGDRVLLVVASITNLEPLKVIMSFTDNLFHFAAETHVDRSIIYPHRFVFTDVIGTYFLLYAFKEINGQRGKFLHISTDEIYGEILKGKAKENSPFYPSSPYSASKAGADRLVYSFYKTYSLPVIIVRPSNVFGERQFPEKFIPLSIMKILMKEKIPLYGDGKQKRSWIYQEDAVRGIYLIFKKGKIGEEYNLPGNTELENVRVAEIICDLAGVEKEKFIEFVKDRPAHDRRYSLDGSKLFSLGFKYNWNFSDAIKRTFEFYKENFKFYKKLLKEKKVKKFMDIWYSNLKKKDEV
ncbi:MAG: GDP-mannose 4,6-dehydratase [Candidatus Hydrothermales bacterium]